MTDQPSQSASSEEAPPPPPASVPEPSTGSIDDPKPLAPVTSSAPSYRPSYLFLAVVSIATLAADLGSKHWAKGRLEDGKTFAERHIEVVKGVWSFMFARNRGGAWGLLQDEPESIRRPFFLGISVLAIVFIVSLYRKLTPQQWALRWGLPLVLGGALGNLVNRIQYNFVVDFIDFQWKGHHWPTFNVADIAIVVGVGLMAIDMFTPRKPAPRPAAASAGIAPDPAPFAPDPPPAPGGETAPKET
jgi:signal peptidase II